MGFPKMLTVIQNYPVHKVKDIAGTVQAELQRADFASRVKPGGSIAIGVGSRGISNIAEIAAAAVAYWKSHGMQPFLFPAMGSHGSATAQGQADVLAHYGITEATMGCPIVSSLDVVPVGTTPEGIRVVLDKNAHESDGIMLLGRVKWHTDYEGGIESGLFKMMAIGLGKWAGAQHYHTHAYKLGLGRTVETIGREMLKTGKVLGGLAILEDAYHNTGQLTAVPVENMEAGERELLALVKTWMAKIPMDLDLLIVDEIGKNISGAGMDTKVVNRAVSGEYNPWSIAPKISRIFVRDLSNNTYGNASGIGFADVTTDRLVAKIESESTYINALTASTPTAVRIPIHFATDQECIERIGKTCGVHDMKDLRIGRILNSLTLSPIVLSENMRAEIEANPLLEIVGDGYDLEYGADDNLAAIKGVALEVFQHA